MDPAAPPSPPGRAQYDTDRDASGDGGGSGGVGRTAAWAGHAASDGDAMPSPAPAPPPPAAAGATLAEELLRIAAALAQNTSITHAQWRALEEMVAASDEVCAWQALTCSEGGGGYLLLLSRCVSQNLLSAVSVYFSLRPSDVPGGSPRASFKSHHSEAACAADLVRAGPRLRPVAAAADRWRSCWVSAQAYLARVYAMAGSDGWHGPGARGPSPAADDVDTAPRRGSRRGAGSGDADDSDGSTSSDGSCPSDVAPPIVGKRLSVRQPRRPVVVAARYGRAPEAADARTGPDAGAALGAAAPTVAPTAVPAAASCDRRVGEPTGAGAPMLDPGGVLNFVGHGAAVGRQHRGSIIPVPTVTPRHLTNEAVRLSGAAPVAATATGVPPRPAPASRVRAVSAAMGSRRSTPWTPTGAAAAARVARPPSATALRPRGEGGASGSGAGSAVAAAPAVAASASAAVAAAVAALEQRVAAVAAASAVALASTAGPASRGGASGRRSVVEAAQAGAAPQSAPRSEGARAPAAESADPGSARRGFASPRALGARSASGDSADGGGNGGGGDGGGGISRSESAASEQFILLVQPSARRSTPWRLNLKPSSLAAKGPVPRTPGRPQMPTSGRRSARPARLAADA